VVWCCLFFHDFVSFHFLCAESLGESFVVVAWWSYIVLVLLIIEDFYCSTYFEW
jgi:hypothetical protein